MFAWAAENDLVPAAVHQALLPVAGLRKDRTAAREKLPVGPVADEAVEKTLPHLSPTVAAMVRLLRLTGMRPQEVVLLRASEIDRRDGECWVYRPQRHKGRASRPAIGSFTSGHVAESCSDHSSRPRRPVTSSARSGKRRAPGPSCRPGGSSQ